MGMLLDFVCPACGLKGHVSGGEDCGMVAATTTIYCEICGTLQDAAVVEERFAAVPKRIEIRCEKVKSHRIKLWNRDEPCPRCLQGLLTVDEAGMVTMWD